MHKGKKLSDCFFRWIACSFAVCQDAEQRADALAAWKLLVGSGVCLALHFSFWVWSLDHTSLTHSLLFVCSTPVIIALGTLLLRKPITRVRRGGYGNPCNL
jgi:drug/metabolite transporter (DMT)-like permease